MRQFIAILLTTSTLAAADRVREAPKPVAPRDAGLGHGIKNISFTDLANQSGQLRDYSSSRYLVVAITSTTCPLSQKYAPTLAKLEQEYTAKNVAFLFVNPIKTDSPKSSFKGRYVHDTNGQVAAALGVRSTTEVVVLDAARTVVYRGAVDDQYGLGYSLEQPRKHYLKDALDHLLAGKTAEIRATTAPGCELELPTLTPTPITFQNRISRLMQQNCQECHRAGGTAPFALVSYDDVVAHKGMIRKVVERGTMPPWFAAPSSGASHFLNDSSLAPRDKADLLAWLASDLPKGNDADAPLAKSWPSEWAIGTPDAVIQLPKPIEIKASGTMPYRRVEVETHFDDDKWIEAYEVQPTARAQVHHVLVHVVLKTGGLGRFFPGARAGIDDDERQGYFAAYVPGNGHVSLPPGFARKLPKGATLRFELHYTPNGTATTDQTRVAFRFAKEPPKQEVKVGAVVQLKLNIPPGEDNHKEVGKLKVPTDVMVRSFVPHMHVRAKACRYELTTPDGRTTTLLDIPHYDFNWQIRYQFAEPIRITKGSTLSFAVWYDNSTKNPANPDPTVTVKWGPQTWDEMHIGYVEYYVERGTGDPTNRELFDLSKPAIPKEGVVIPEKHKKGLARFDLNNDGKLTEQEIEAMPEAIKQRVYNYLRN